MHISGRNNCKTSSGNQTRSNFYRNHTSLQQGVEDELLLDFRRQAGPAPTCWRVCGQALAGTQHQHTTDERFSVALGPAPQIFTSTAFIS